jgi:hypothetical protein
MAAIVVVGLIFFGAAGWMAPDLGDAPDAEGHNGAVNSATVREALEPTSFRGTIGVTDPLAIRGTIGVTGSEST